MNPKTPLPTRKSLTAEPLEGAPPLALPVALAPLPALPTNPPTGVVAVASTLAALAAEAVALANAELAAEGSVALFNKTVSITCNEPDQEIKSVVKIVALEFPEEIPNPVELVELEDVEDVILSCSPAAEMYVFPADNSEE